MTDAEKEIEERNRKLESLVAQLRRDRIAARSAHQRAERLLSLDLGTPTTAEAYDALAHVAATVTRQLVTLARRLKEVNALGIEHAADYAPLSGDRRVQREIIGFECEVNDVTQTFTDRF